MIGFLQQYSGWMLALSWLCAGMFGVLAFRDLDQCQVHLIDQQEAVFRLKLPEERASRIKSASLDADPEKMRKSEEVYLPDDGW